VGPGAGADRPWRGPQRAGVLRATPPGRPLPRWGD
jgi:hypothetical protein